MSKYSVEVYDDYMAFVVVNNDEIACEVYDETTAHIICRLLNEHEEQSND